MAVPIEPPDARITSSPSRSGLAAGAGLLASAGLLGALVGAVADVGLAAAGALVGAIVGFGAAGCADGLQAVIASISASTRPMTIAGGLPPPRGLTDRHTL